MPDLQIDFIVSVAFSLSVSVGLFVRDVDVDGWTFFLQIFLLEKEAQQGRADGDSVVGCIDHYVEIFFGNDLLMSPVFP